MQRTKDSEILSIKNRLTVKVFFMRYPELHKFLLDELQEGAVNEDSLSLYPVLLLLSRLYPLNFGDEASNSKVIMNCVNCAVCSIFVFLGTRICAFY